MEEKVANNKVSERQRQQWCGTDSPQLTMDHLVTVQSSDGPPKGTYNQFQSSSGCLPSPRVT